MLAWFWSHSHRQRLVMLACLLGMLVHLGFTVHRRTWRPGDYEVHREFGRRFVEGEPLYAGGHCFNYMPISAMHYAPMALLPPTVGVAIRYLVALACLGLTLHLLWQMIRDRCHAADKRFLICAVTIVLSLHYLARDLDDGGPHLILLALLTGGIYAASKLREKQAAVWFALAIALKMTPGLFLPFFLWKRKFKLAFYTAVALVGWIALPAICMGPSSWWQHQQQWNRMALGIGRGAADPMRDDNELRVQNQTLKLAVERALVEYPPGHPLRLEHAGYIGGLGLAPSTANRVALVVLAAVGGLCAWRARGRYRSPDDPRWLLESSGVMLLVILFSPVTWLQHMVLVIPGLFLLATEHLAIHRLPRAALALAGLYAFMTLVLTRELIGKENYFLLLSYQLHTACLCLVLGLLLWLRPTARDAEQMPQTMPMATADPPATLRRAG